MRPNTISCPPPVVLLCLWFLPGAGLAVDRKGAGEQKDVPVRFLAVGEAPPWRQVQQQQLPPPPGSVPPALRISGAAGDGNEALALKLDQVSKPLRLRSGEIDLVYTEGGNKGSAWHRVTVAPRASLVVLWRDPVEKTWSKARSLVLPDGAVAVPAGTVRIVNVSELAMSVTLGKKGLALEPRKSVLLGEREALVNENLEIGIPDGKGRFKRICQQVLNAGPNERTQIVIYRSDGENPRRPAKVLIWREPAK